MARRQIPKNAGRFCVSIAKAGNYIVLNDKSGGNKIVIACRDLAQAERLCARLDSGDHDGEIWI
jgi:hypothetical protein